MSIVARCRHGVTLCVIGLQVAGIMVARWVPERFFCWAPYDALHAYVIEASVNGHPLGENEILERYEVAARGTEHRSIAHLTETIRWIEERAEEPATVVLRYTLNGGAQTEWHWSDR